MQLILSELELLLLNDITTTLGLQTFMFEINLIRLVRVYMKALTSKNSTTNVTKSCVRKWTSPKMLHFLHIIYLTNILSFSR